MNKLFSEIAKKNNSELIELWNATDKMIISLELAEIRENIMRVLESRDSKKFNDWLSADYPNDKMEYFFEVN